MRFGILLILAVFLLPGGVVAQDLPTIPDTDPCPVSFLPCGGGGAVGASAYLINNLFPAVRIIFIAVAVLSFLQYSVKLLFDPESSDTVSSAKLAYGYGITACAVVGIATFIVEAVGQNARNTLINPEPISEGISNIIFYMRLVVAVLVTVFILFEAVRLIIKQGSEDEFDNARKQFFHMAMGVVVILVANSLVLAFLPGSGSILLGQEIAGLISFTLTIIGGLALLTIMIAGVLMVVSIDEELHNRAKRTIFIAFIGLMVSLLCYIIVRFFINAASL